MDRLEATYTGAGGTRLYYQRRRPSAEPLAAVLAVHGLSDHSGGLRRMTDHLLEQGYSIYSPDLRGHGRSPGQRGHVGSWADFRDDLDAFVRVVRAAEPGLPVFLLGHSLGGLISVEYTLRHPGAVDGLIAVAPALSLSVSPGMRALLMALSLIRPAMCIEEKPDFGKLSRDPEVVAALAADPQRHRCVTPSLGRQVLGAQRWTVARSAQLDLPFLLLYGLDDPITPAGGIRSFFDGVRRPDKEQHAYPGVRHRPFDDLGREQMLADLVTWLDGQTAGLRSAAATI